MAREPRTILKYAVEVALPRAVRLLGMLVRAPLLSVRVKGLKETQDHILSNPLHKSGRAPSDRTVQQCDAHRGKCRGRQRGQTQWRRSGAAPAADHPGACWLQEPVLERVVYEDIPANLSALKHRAEQVKFQHRIQELEAQGETPLSPASFPCTCSLPGSRPHSDAAKPHWSTLLSRRRLVERATNHRRRGLCSHLEAWSEAGSLGPALSDWQCAPAQCGLGTGFSGARALSQHPGIVPRVPPSGPPCVVSSPPKGFPAASRKIWC